MRLFLLFLYVCASGSFVWFIFLVEDIIPSSTGKFAMFLVQGIKRMHGACYHNDTTMKIILIFILQLHNLAITINDQHRNLDP
jgi:hypothetical protein